MKAHGSAEETYGEGRRAHQTAYAALKHTHEKLGGHWEPKKTHLLKIAKKLDITGRPRMSKSKFMKAIQRASGRQTARARRG